MSMQVDIFSTESKGMAINKPIRLIETFAGIGAQAKALENIGADFVHYRICEFDKYAVTAYNAIHGTNFPVSDITKWHAADMGIEEKDKYEYIVTYSFPCQSLSIAGKCAGMAKGSGTRSGLLWEVERLLEECDGNLPQILLMENVDAILFEKNRKHFFQWCNRLEEFGYKNYYQVLNAKDYGIPQNRNRCYMVSILGDYYFEFPKPIKLELCVKDMLEKEVPEKYYISSKAVEGLLRAEATKGHKPAWLDKDGTAPAIDTRVGATTHWSPYVKEEVCMPCLTPARMEKRQNGRRFKENGDPMFTLTAQDIHGVIVSNPDIKQVGNISNSASFGGNPQTGRVYDPEYICPAINTMGGGQREPKFLVADGIAIRTNNEKGYDIAQDGDTINLEQPNSKTRRGRVGKQIAQTIMTSTEQAVVEKEITPNNKYRIRKLMPIECFRLMGFTREDFFKVKAVGISDSQCYKQAGNSIVVQVLEAIFRNINMKGVKRWDK